MVLDGSKLTGLQSAAFYVQRYSAPLHCYPLNRRLCGPLSQYECFGEEKKSHLHQKMHKDSSDGQPVA